MRIMSQSSHARSSSFALNIAVAAEVGNSAALQKAVRESFAVVQTPPVAGPFELALLARYAVIGRDFTTAKKIATQIPNEDSHQREGWSDSESEHLATSGARNSKPGKLLHCPL